MSETDQVIYSKNKEKENLEKVEEKQLGVEVTVIDDSSEELKFEYNKHCKNRDCFSKQKELQEKLENVKEQQLDGDIVIDDISESNFEDDKHYELQEYFCKQKEWPGIKSKHEAYKSPFLIKELYRFVPYKTDTYIKFHAFNMPDVKIKAVQFVGIVLEILHKSDGRFIILTVNDGTAAVTVVYNREKFDKMVKNLEQINSKHKRFMIIATKKKPWIQNDNKDQNLKVEDRVVHTIYPPFEYPLEIPRDYRLKLHHNWWVETRGGLLGKEFEIGDYVYVDGFCSLDFDRIKKPKGPIEAHHLSYAKLICNATNITCITEEEYNNKLQYWIETYVKRRY